MPIIALVPVLAALAGVVVGGLIAEVRVVMEMRRERRKALNRVLWCQLDLWYELERSDMRSLVDLFLSRLANRLAVKEEELGMSDAQREIMGRIVADVAKAGRHPESEVHYHQAVEALAFFDPVLAYRLSGKTVLTQHREHGDAYLNAVVHEFGPSELTENDVKIEAMMRPWIQKELYDSACQTLREDVETLREL